MMPDKPDDDLEAALLTVTDDDLQEAILKDVSTRSVKMAMEILGELFKANPTADRDALYQQAEDQATNALNDILRQVLIDHGVMQP